MDPDIYDWTPKLLYWPQSSQDGSSSSGEQTSITLKGYNLGRRKWNCLYPLNSLDFNHLAVSFLDSHSWSLSPQYMILPGVVSARDPREIVCSIPSKMVKDLKGKYLMQPNWRFRRFYLPKTRATMGQRRGLLWPLLSQLSRDSTDSWIFSNERHDKRCYEGNLLAASLTLQVTIKGSGFKNVPSAVVKFGYVLLAYSSNR